MKGTDQLAVSSMCIAFYYTAAGTAKPSTKVASMRQAKALAHTLGISIPMQVLSRLYHAISRVANEQTMREVVAWVNDTTVGPVAVARLFE